jgi:hypothetical protein
VDKCNSLCGNLLGHSPAGQSHGWKLEIFVLKTELVPEDPAPVLSTSHLLAGGDLGFVKREALLPVVQAGVSGAQLPWPSEMTNSF